MSRVTNGQRASEQRVAKHLADISSDAIASTFAKLARSYFRRTVKVLPPRPKAKLACSRPVTFAVREEQADRQTAM